MPKSKGCRRVAGPPLRPRARDPHVAAPRFACSNFSVRICAHLVVRRSAGPRLLVDHQLVTLLLLKDPRESCTVPPQLFLRGRRMKFSFATARTVQAFALATGMMVWLNVVITLGCALALGFCSTTIRSTDTTGGPIKLHKWDYLKIISLQVESTA